MEKPKVDFCLQVDFTKDSEKPSRVFRSIYELIETFQFIDRSLVSVVDSRIEPLLLLEDVESGSIKIWLSNFLKAIPDDSIYHLDWKPIIGQYLVKAKYFIVYFLEGRIQITSIKEIRPLIQQINALAEETKVRWLGDYQPVQPRALLEGMQKISENLSYLSPGDKATYITDTDKAEFNLEFKMAPESLDEILESEQIANEGEHILKVKKPDYLGDSQWELRQGSRNFLATIYDKDWLAGFQARRVEIRPGDAIRVRMKETHHYDYAGEVIRTTYDVLEVKEVIPGGDQLELFGDEPST